MQPGPWQEMNLDANQHLRFMEGNKATFLLFGELKQGE